MDAAQPDDLSHADLSHAGRLLADENFVVEGTAFPDIGVAWVVRKTIKPSAAAVLVAAPPCVPLRVVPASRR